ncbi:DUF2786 domain-containing protein [Streptococcus suis]|uniref:DUF2786 domain-containing protein n=1 Tax=Streptococcus suis TaxID=1307 RepID=UPI00209B0B76|nr:DUF2786 domain-containing protein [Streptococcus suis]MCO8221715.1 DUF2786 domain-containing protein [Streptococcus suis]HEM3469281.1 DUF2786 domain-containing protein [Streptococcus suis]
MENKIVTKIQNLLELAYDAPNDEEGQTALLMAQKLMVKHNLSLKDVKNTHNRENIGETVAGWAFRMQWWKEELAAILGQNFRCQTIRRRIFDEGITQMIFFGYDTDAELCTKIYEGAILYLEYRIKRLFPTVEKERWLGYKKSYLMGFLTGLDDRFKQQSQATEEFSLTVQVPAEVAEERQRQLGELKKRTAKAPIEQIDVEAYVIGLEHAKESKLLQEELLNKSAS